MAHLRASGIDAYAFGQPLEFWLEHMPDGMFLRSSYRACYISDPTGELTLDRYERLHGLAREEGPVSIGRFINYGQWFQRSVVPDVDRRRVMKMTRGTHGFSLILDDGSVFEASRVAVAAGIRPFAWRPPEFTQLPSDLVSHTSDHRDFRDFKGRQVLVVGAGQSALESAALLHEAGAEVEVVSRSPTFRWNPNAAQTGDRTPIAIKRLRAQLHHLRYPPHDVGPPGWNWLVASPDLWRLLPQRLQAVVERNVTYPRGATWLPDRLANVTMHGAISVIDASESRGHVTTILSDGNRRVVDHVLLGTGYRVDASRYEFLDANVVGDLCTHDGYPVLGRGLESSIPGLHFLGAPAALSFGPVMNFVCGAAYGGRALTSLVLGRRPRRIDFAW
jgi:cation diffusion facilitator CzcD-associated flavoprotein CzcO